VVLAALARTMVPVGVGLVLTLLAAFGVLLKIPADLSGLPFLLGLIGGVAGFFVLAGGLLSGRGFTWAGLGPPPDDGASAAEQARVAALLSACSVVLPFLLLVIIVGRLAMAEPGPVFGLALVLVGMALAVTLKFRLPAMPPAVLFSLALVEYASHALHFRGDEH